jgi:hypothetical protein
MQCLLHTDELVKYFLLHYETEAFKGEAAKYFSLLVQEVWMKVNSEALALGNYKSGDSFMEGEATYRIKDLMIKKNKAYYDNFD